jgi:hypothetical protein
MAKLSRRGVLLLTAAGVGEIGALAAAAAAGAHFAPVSPVPATRQSPAQSNIHLSPGPLAAFVPDTRRDTIVIMHGEQELTITNPALVQALLSFSSL